MDYLTDLEEFRWLFSAWHRNRQFLKITQLDPNNHLLSIGMIFNYWPFRRHTENTQWNSSRPEFVPYIVLSFTFIVQYQPLLTLTGPNFGEL